MVARDSAFMVTVISCVLERFSVLGVLDGAIEDCLDLLALLARGGRGAPLLAVVQRPRSFLT